MKYLGILMAISVLFSINNSYAASALICEASGKMNGITVIHAEDSNPAPEVCVASSVKLPPVPEFEVVHCSKGSIFDSSIEVSVLKEKGIGTSRVFIEKAILPTEIVYILKETFACDTALGEERCSDSSETVVQREILNCNLIRE